MSTRSTPAPIATEQDGRYPRPQLMRPSFLDLDGVWSFAHDDSDIGVAERWFERDTLDREIVVPFPPESPASGIGDTGLHPVVWYSRTVGDDELRAIGLEGDRRIVLHFGAVDYRCRVWVDGVPAGEHEGGQSPFELDLTDVLGERERHSVVVRAEDDPLDIAQPRGKQDWLERPHVIWYHRTSGIWQPVWLETVPRVAVRSLAWSSDLPAGEVRLRLRLTRRPEAPVPLSVRLHRNGETIAELTRQLDEPETEIVLPVAALGNGQGYEELLWSPENPRLVDAAVTVGDDEVSSYLGLRSAAVSRRRFLLNDRPVFVRSVLEQGYWPESHLAAPSADALRDEVALIKDLGFTAARLHQKYEDPRFLFWADRLGLMVWAEAPATFAFSPLTVSRTVREWLDIVERDLSHPSIVTWVPLNESWGVQHIAADPRMQHFARTMVELTKALDPTRPVVSNDGWEQVDTDIVAIHDYEGDAEIVAGRYRDRDAIDRLIAGIGPAGRRLVLSGDVDDAPVMLTEFGGISFDVDRVDAAWGYTAATSREDYAARLGALLSAVNASRELAGFCYTQFSDTVQETNGLVGADRVPKLPVDELRAMVTGA